MSGTRQQTLDPKRQLKAEYGELFDSIAGLLFRHDPAGVNFEVNPNEYEYEAAKILPHLRTCQSAEDVRQLVHAQLVGSFDPVTAGPPERYSQIASEIWQFWQKYQAANKPV
jgi:hypothetical protein